MSIQDPTYGQLYYKAIKSDPTGLIAQCIYSYHLLLLPLLLHLQDSIHQCLSPLHFLIRAHPRDLHRLHIPIQYLSEI